MSTRQINVHTLHCDVTGCESSLDDDEFGGAMIYDTPEEAMEAAEVEEWTVTPLAITYGPRLIERFAVCPDENADHNAARKLIAKR